MKDVVYLFGAGASYGAGINERVLPILTELGERINGIAYSLEKNHWLVNKCGRAKVDIGVLINELRLISKETGRHSSIDTIARKYFLQGDMNSYQKIKALINFIFCYMELEKREYSIDKRYDSFFATILDSSLKLPSNCIMLSWNYDIQVERAYAQYKKTGNLSEARVHLNYRSGNFVANAHKIEADPFILKLNGTCGILENDNLMDFTSDFAEYNYEEVLFKLVSKWNLPLNRNPIKYAWELDPENEEIRKIITRVLKADTLVVVGYSFPYFNRVIDKILFGSYNFTKVIVMAPNAEEILETFEAFAPVNAKYPNGENYFNRRAMKNVNSFFIPDTFMISDDELEKYHSSPLGGFLA